MIDYIVHYRVSKADINGNRYWLAIVTSTATGRSALVRTHHSSNVRNEIRVLKGYSDYHSSVHEIEHQNVPIREWNRQAKQCSYYEYQLAELLAEIDRAAS